MASTQTPANQNFEIFMRTVISQQSRERNTPGYDVRFPIPMFVFVLTAYSNTGATTCIADKIFKVKQVCGRVVDPMDTPIPGVEVELLDSDSNLLQKAHTNESGIFNIQNVLPGQYVIRVQFVGFARAWQPFVLTRTG
jgi:Carboxypeptidase regulatory-like domain